MFQQPATRNFWISKIWLLAILSGYCHAAKADVDYIRDIKPILKSRCYACHGALTQKAGLRLDTVAMMHRGGDSGDVIQKSDSLLIERVTTKEKEDHMPPEGEGSPLSPVEVDKLRQWINAGASGPADEKPEPGVKDHWAFAPVHRPEIPQIRGNWPINNPIDAFLAKDFQARGLKPNDRADRLTLLRRLHFDMTGLPPTPDDIRRVSDMAGEKWLEEEVTRLLNSPRHGERWARHWMDIWRYSDWWGLGAEHRNSQKFIWHWRDWIVESLNADRPYDEMVRLQLAADELKPNDLGDLRATGYLARNYFLFNRNQWLDETVEHVSKSFLGITTNCAKCHDHKFDPIKQTDYYAMRAIFEPYMVRNEILPGQINAATDGIPRAYDARPDEPTYRYIRGSEANPDKSAVIAPGVPTFISGKNLELRPVQLPAEARHPGLRPHILDGLRKYQLSKQAEARAGLQKAVKQWQEASMAVIAAKPAKQDGPSPEKLALEKLLARVQAEKALQLADMEIPGIEARARADRATVDNKEQSESVVKAAIEAERRVALAQAELKLATAELALVQGKAGKGGDLATARDKAQAEVNEARGKLGDTSGRHTRLVGAEHIPTKFLTSTAFDPFPGFPEKTTGRRMALANWITDRANPLPARVAVNHIWARHFGQPLVPTMFDFGRKGTPPENLELLDWLASELVASGWSMKHVHRLIVSSAAWQRQSSLAGRENEIARDPDNRYFWRWPGMRLESQAVRDSILALSGRLDFKMGGPPIPAGEQEKSVRRSLYFFHSNNDRNSFLTAFDEAMVKECYRREQSIVPQQALALSNSRLVFESAPALVAKIEAGMSDQKDSSAFIRRSFELLLGFVPSNEEIQLAREALGEFQNKAPSGKADETTARGRLVWALLNHNDFVTLR